MSKKKKVIIKKSRRSLSQRRYSSVQKSLSRSLKENGVKVGRDFNSIASKIYKSTKQEKLSFLNKNMFVFYKDIILNQDDESKKSVGALIPPPKEIMFYNFVSELHSPIFEGIEITVEFKDGIKGELEYTGFAMDVIHWYEQNLHAHLRNNYNDSPTALFRMTKFVPDMEVTYKVIVEEKGGGGNSNNNTDKETGRVKSGGGGIKNKVVVSKEERIEREKRKTLEEKVKAYERLKELGMSESKIEKYLGL